MDYNILKKSLKMVAEFAQNSHAIHTIPEFMAIHERNKIMLHQYIVTEKDDFVKELLDSIPEISSAEVKKYMEHDRGLATNKRGVLYILKLFINNGKEDIDFLKEKFDFISNRNNTMIMILENSGF